MTEDWTQRPFVDVPEGTTPPVGAEALDAEFLNALQISLRAKLNAAEADGRYVDPAELATALAPFLTGVPSEFLTETEGDGRYALIGSGSGSGGLATTTIAALKAIDTTSATTYPADTRISVLGYYSAFDRAGIRTYRLDRASSLTDNGGSIIAPTTGVGRWRLVWDGSFCNALHWGAKPDDATFDNLPIHNAMLAYLSAGRPNQADGTIYYPEGLYDVSGTMVYKRNMVLLGDGVDLTIFRPKDVVGGSSFNVIEPSIINDITRGLFHFRLEKFAVYGNKATGIYSDTGTVTNPQGVSYTPSSGTWSGGNFVSGKGHGIVLWRPAESSVTRDIAARDCAGSGFVHIGGGTPHISVNVMARWNNRYCYEIDGIERQVDIYHLSADGNTLGMMRVAGVGGVNGAVVNVFGFKAEGSQFYLDAHKDLFVLDNFYGTLNVIGGSATPANFPGSVSGDNVFKVVSGAPIINAQGLRLTDYTNITTSAAGVATPLTDVVNLYDGGWRSVGYWSTHQGFGVLRPPRLSLITPVTIANSAVETVLGQVTIPKEILSPGMTYRVRASGVISTIITTPGTVTWRIRIGNVVLGNAIVTSLAPVPANAAAQTNKPWEVDFLVTVRSSGSAGTIIGNGRCVNEFGLTTADMLKGSATVAAVAVNTGSQRMMGLTFQFGLADAGNSITVHNLAIEPVVG